MLTRNEDFPIVLAPAEMPAESLDWYLAQTGAKILIVDFRSSRKNAGIGGLSNLRE